MRTVGDTWEMEPTVPAGAILEDRSLHELQALHSVLDPFDLKLGTSFRRVRDPGYDQRVSIDLANVPHQDEITRQVDVPMGESFWLKPGEAALGSTLERIFVPHHLAMYLDGKSSLGRLFLAVHITAGYFDPGFTGVGTLEFVNLFNRPLILRPGLPICQARWMTLVRPPRDAYSGHYQGDEGATGSRYGARESAAR
jgi:dCTP deaminase